MSEVIFCMKIVGSTMVLSAGTMIGYLYGRDITLHCEELETLKRYFQIMKSDIQYSANSLQEIFEHLRFQCKDDHKEWFSYVIEAVEEGTNQRFELIWKDSIHLFMNDIKLHFDELEELIEVGMSLGSVDREQQNMMINLYLEQLEYRIKVLKKESLQKKKLYHLIGITGSLFVVIMLL